MKAEINSVLQALNQRPIAFHPIYKELTGSYEGALLLSQIMYWYSATGREFYKTNDDFREELFMTEREFRRAKAAIKSVPFIKVKRRGVPAKTYYSINFDLYAASMKVAVDSLYTRRTNQLVHTPYELDGTPAVPTITENTTETTTDILVANAPEQGASEEATSSSKEQKQQQSKASSVPAKKKDVTFRAPTKEEVAAWSRDWAINKHKDLRAVMSIAEEARQYYERGDWADRDGKKVKSWKRKIAMVWLTDEKIMKARKTTGGGGTEADVFV